MSAPAEDLSTPAVVLSAPERLELRTLPLDAPGEADVVVDVEWSGVSTGTERLLWSGRMPDFPGMGYPLVPGYEAVGRVRAAGARSGRCVGERVFAPGARCFGAVRGLFGAAAARIVAPGARTVSLNASLSSQQAVLLALAATAQHALAAHAPPDLIVGHGVLGRLLARLTLLHGAAPPTVWERNPVRRTGADGYAVLDPHEDERRDYRVIYDASGDASLLDELIGRLGPGGELVLAGFYAEPVQFAFAPAFMRELRLRIAAQWREADLIDVRDWAEAGALKLGDLVTHRCEASHAARAYRQAFDDPACLKMILDWRGCA